MGVFYNDPFEAIDLIFHKLYPDKKYFVVLCGGITKGHETLVGHCQPHINGTWLGYEGDYWVISLSMDVKANDLIAVLIHELSHIIGDGHDQLFEETAKLILSKYSNLSLLVIFANFASILFLMALVISTHLQRNLLVSIKP